MEHSKAKLFLIFLIFFSFSYGETVIYLKNEVLLTKDRIYLSDIATVSSDNKALESFLSSIYISSLKKSRIITDRQIKERLKENSINPDSIKFVGRKVVVKRKIPVLDEGYLKERVASYLNKNYKNIRVKNIRCSLRPLKVENPVIKIYQRSKSSSHIYITANIFSGERKIRQINCTVKYSQLIDAVVAKKDLMRGQVISRSDVEIKKVEFEREIITDISTVEGAVTKTFIKEGKPIKTFMIQIDYPVKKRDYVRVVYDRNGIKIEITGIALENGVIGQSIKVKNSSTGKLLRCRVIGRGTVLFISGY
ncbi:flagellar basal body P-ring formation protein FlgA [Persephonella atlantica]|uniref:Flagellar basal body P-ring formation protein FlgA n=1 Tax=Persephonella atlantica TaxID=2699429 RepID=A0ABS1GHS7_9AQUI|nr:flagellar basal body P-ring formation chaperone FlgA [Persephonella atlantica]MBK3332484.1 flagellar basal body P-ring formation protein FlgA [Persephonella atlantica]